MTHPSFGVNHTLMARSRYVQEGRGVYKLDKFGLPTWLYNMARVTEAVEEVACLNGTRRAVADREARRAMRRVMG